jgi:hypothetical protein
MARPTDLLAARLAGEASDLMARARGMCPPVTLVIERGRTLDCEDVGKFQCVGSWSILKFQGLGIFRVLLIEDP